MKNDQKYFYQVIIIIAISFLSMLGYQFGYNHFPYLKNNYRNFSFFESLIVKTKPKPKEHTYVVPKTVSTDSISTNNQSKVAAVSTSASSIPKKDTIAPKPITTPKSSIQILDTAIVNQIPKHNWLDMDPFFNALSALTTGNRKKVRIAYFGDSMIEGDLIVSAFRERLQTKYGGNGVGYIPVTSNVAGFRRTVKHKFSNNWKSENMQRHLNIHKHPFDISGYNHQINDTLGAWFTFSCTRYGRHLESFSNLKLFYGANDSIINVTDSIQLVFNETDTLYRKLDLKQRLNICSVSQPNAKSVHVELPNQYKEHIFYGASLEDTIGIYVDNFALRGSSGAQLQYLDSTIMSAFSQNHPYDLVVLQYGTNVCDTAVHNFSWYKYKFRKAIQHIKHNWDAVPCLVVSLADKAIKIDGELQTSPAVSHVLKAQYNAAQSAHASFYNLYQNMGGQGSMIEWVEAIKPLANKDYTHMNFRGARKVGTMLVNYLLAGHKEYTKRKEKELEIDQPQAVASTKIIENKEQVAPVTNKVEDERQKAGGVQ